MRPPDRRLGLLLAPGAGADRDHAALVAVDRAVAQVGVTVVRMDFPYRRAGRRAPDRPAVLIQAVTEAAAAMRADVDALVLGGRSMGGRMCSMAVAGGLAAVGLVLVSYPLHPPGRPDRLRTEHLTDLHVPCLFVSGTRDAFGTRDELEVATADIPAPVTHHWIDGGDHGLRSSDSEVAAVVTAWLVDLAGQR